MSKTPGVTEIYQKASEDGRYEYRRIYKSEESQPQKYQQWAKMHHAEILNAMAAEDSPDLVGLLADDAGFDLIGDHGGAQEKVQRIPLLLRVPNDTPSISDSLIRLYELRGKIEQSFGIAN